MRELQSVLGKLNFARSFVPFYRKIVKPLLSIQRKDSMKVWTREHTDALNELIRHVLKRVELGIVDMGRAAMLHVDSDKEAGLVVLTQGEG